MPGAWRLRDLAYRRFLHSGQTRVGWVAAGTLHGSDRSFFALEHAVAMRVANTALWLNANVPALHSEIYRPDRRYDIVVFFKAMDDRCLEEAARVQAYGGKVVFDANVNYYEVWGDYEIEDTRPTEEQRRQAAAMTGAADHVVADSSYLLGIVSRFNGAATWIPDNVDMHLFSGPRARRGDSGLRLVWSGIAKKAQPLLSVADAFAGLRGAELVVVSNAEPRILPELRQAIPCRYVPWSPKRYAKVLRECDVIISPKRLVNAYELGHTEYKITLGMAAGVPAVASPQQSYVEAVTYAGGGRIADTTDEWRAALAELAADPALRADLGERARRTVEERYATPVVARRYSEVLCALA